jgi:hypothetical protein
MPGISARRPRTPVATGRSRARPASGPPAGFAATTTRRSRRGRRRCRSRRRRRQGAPGVRASGWRGRTGHRPGPPSDQSITPVISSPSANTWATCRSPCVNTGVHGRSAASATRRLRVTRSVGRTSFVTSHSHSPSRCDAISSRFRQPGTPGVLAGQRWRRMRDSNPRGLAPTRFPSLRAYVRRGPRPYVPGKSQPGRSPVDDAERWRMRLKLRLGESETTRERRRRAAPGRPPRPRRGAGRLPAGA